MSGSIFLTDARSVIEERIKYHLNEHQNLIGARELQSPRAVGDALQTIVSDKFHELAAEFCRDYSSDFARRSMADLAFTDLFGNYCAVDVKTHREDTKFNMPNLTSVERLSRFYEDDKNYFALLLIKYHIEDSRLKVTEVIFRPIESLSWGCLTIGALGWGQIQIANSNHIEIDSRLSRQAWMIELCDCLLKFYPREINKINERVSKFQEVKEFWLQKRDVLPQQ